MLDIAHEQGSAEFEPPLRRLGLPCRIRNLESADFAFWGHGADGMCRVGVERKTVSEMVTPSARGRLTGHQLPRMTLHYRYRFLMVEGLTRVEPRWGSLECAHAVKDGRMCVWQEAGWSRGEAFEAYFKHQLTLQLRAAIHIIPTADRTGTAHALHALYRWFQVPWQRHTSHLKVDEALPDAALIEERTVRRQLFAQIPYIGWTRSLQISRQFEGYTIADTLQWMAKASEQEWCEALGIKQGRKTARQIRSVLHGRDEHDAKA